MKRSLFGLALICFAVFVALWALGADLAAGTVGVIVTAAIVGGLYLIPTFVAAGRRHHQSAPIFLTNLLLGWTVVGWVVALIWASGAVRETEA